jgi:hypothetical protein
MIRSILFNLIRVYVYLIAFIILLTGIFFTLTLVLVFAFRLGCNFGIMLHFIGKIASRRYNR